MTPEEMKVRLWRSRYLATKDDRIFTKIWFQVKNLSPVPRNFRELTEQQWNSIRMVAVLEALREFNPRHRVAEQKLVRIPRKTKPSASATISVRTEGQPAVEVEVEQEANLPDRMKIISIHRDSEMTLLSFIRWKMDNAIRNERKSLVRDRGMVSLDDHYADDEDSSVSDKILFSRMEQQSKLTPSDPEEEESGFQLLISKVEERLNELGEPNLLRAFRLRLKYPSITNRRVAQKLGVSKTYTSSYFRRLRTITDEVIATTDTTLV